ncbi:hypothetical protein [Chryseobacterium sediminis]|nr:hypothetical protein [Chryseobacterium sediminis]
MRFVFFDFLKKKRVCKEGNDEKGENGTYERMLKEKDEMMVRLIEKG